jgi:hypothetical protein
MHAAPLASRLDFHSTIAEQLACHGNGADYAVEVSRRKPTMRGIQTVLITDSAITAACQDRP